jgi:tRNA(His) 5'-end guanylyltransferase
MKDSKDVFGDRMKMYEQAEAGEKFIPLLPICVRLDGKTFHNWTKGLQRPFDNNFREIMVETTKCLVEETCAVVGYTQSDEISLILYSDDIQSSIFFEGKKQKIISVICSLCTAVFNELVKEKFPHKPLAFFDCRAWQVPNIVEATNVLLWRELDATKNSVTMAASCCYSHKELMNVGSADKKEMLYKKGVNWNDYPTYFKRGTYVSRRKVLRELSETERLKIPEKHRPEVGKMVERTTIDQLDIPPLVKVKNRVEVIFNGEKPMVDSLKKISTKDVDPEINEMVNKEFWNLI